jgi:hypothetical protein
MNSPPKEVEMGDHLFLGCVVARELWFKLLHPVGLDALVPGASAKLVVAPGTPTTICRCTPGFRHACAPCFLDSLAREEQEDLPGHVSWRRGSLPRGDQRG